MGFERSDSGFSFGLWVFLVDWLGFSSDSSSGALEGSSLGTGPIGCRS